jgi:hypothetical protein
MWVCRIDTRNRVEERGNRSTQPLVKYYMKMDDDKSKGYTVNPRITSKKQ